MTFVIITGVSGSGKSCAVNTLEDIGYYCIDNMPPMLMTKFAEVCGVNGAFNKVAFVIDIRGRSLFFEVGKNINELRRLGYTVKVVFMSAAPAVIRKRYKETRRTHPLFGECGGDTELAITKESELLAEVRDTADYVIDTSNMNTATLKNNVLNLFMEEVSDSMLINCMSFGFKYGVPEDADLMFDTRFLANPFYVPELKQKTGTDKEVSDFVMNDKAAVVLCDKLNGLFDFLIPQFVKEGKTQLTVGFGCTGGKHRSVTFAEIFNKRFRDSGYKSRVLHRDITK